MNLEIEKDGTEVQKIRFLGPEVSSSSIKYSSAGMNLAILQGGNAAVVHAGANSSGIIDIGMWSRIKNNRLDMEMRDPPPEYVRSQDTRFRHVKFMPTYEFTFINDTEDTYTTKEIDPCRVHGSKHKLIDKVTTTSEFGVRKSYKSLASDFTELECFIIDADNGEIVHHSSSAGLLTGSFESSAVCDGAPKFATCNYYDEVLTSGNARSGYIKPQVATFKGQTGQYDVRVYYKDSVTVADNIVRSSVEPIYSKRTTISGSSWILHSKRVHYQTSGQYSDREGYASNDFASKYFSGLSCLKFTMDDDGNWQLAEERIS